MENGELLNLKEIKNFYKKRIEPFIAILILVFLIVAVVGLFKEIKIKEEVRENCGYQVKEDIYCVCNKDVVSHIKTKTNPYYEDNFTGEE